MMPCYFAGASICRSSLNFLSSRQLSSLMQVNILCRIPKLTISRNSMLLCSWRVVKRLFSVGHLSRSCFVPIGILSHRVLTNSPLVVQCRQKPSVPSRLLPSEAVRSTDSKFDWVKLWKFLSPDFFLLILAAISAVVVAAINIQIPLLLGELINTISHLTPGLQVKAYSGLLLGPGMKLAGYYCVQCLFTFVYITLLSVVGERFAVRLRTELFRSLMHQDIAFFDSRKTGELVSRLSADVQDFKSSFKMIVSQGLRSVTQTVGCVGSLLFISSEMTSVIAVTLPLMIGVGTLLGRALRRWSRQAQDQIAVATGVADEALGNVRTVRAFAMEEKEMELYAEELNKSSWFNEKLGSGIGLFQGLSNLAINGIVLVVVCHGGLLLANNRLSPGDLMSFLIATQTIQRSLASTSVLFGHLVRGMSAGSRVFEYMDYKPTIRLKGGLTLSPDDMQGNVELKGVTFAYPSRPDQVVLKDLSLCIPAGKVTALCGFSGAGKSTIAALLERFYDPQEGTVLIDERPLSAFDPTWFRESVIGIIHQEPVLFATTVMENIRYGKPTATDEEVYEVAKIANADEFVREFPNGYSTVVGERGHSVSGGQKQRIAISRALLKNPKILILDEATSALDSHSEKLVQEALDRASKGRTVVVIAHRLSTIRNADMIAVIHNGMLREIGTHDELLKGRGLYSQLIQRQTITHEMY